MNILLDIIFFMNSMLISASKSKLSINELKKIVLIDTSKDFTLDNYSYIGQNLFNIYINNKHSLYQDYENEILDLINADEKMRSNNLSHFIKRSWIITLIAYSIGMVLIPILGAGFLLLAFLLLKDLSFKYTSHSDPESKRNMRSAYEVYSWGIIVLEPHFETSIKELNQAIKVYSNQQSLNISENLGTIRSSSSSKEVAELLLKYQAYTLNANAIMMSSEQVLSTVTGSVKTDAFSKNVGGTTNTTHTQQLSADALVLTSSQKKVDKKNDNASSEMQNLKELVAMHKDGLLSDTEFTTMKTKIFEETS